MTFNFLSAPFTSVLIRPRRSIGGIEATVTIEESAEDTLEITKHPVQNGADVSDHAYKNPSEVTIRAMWDSNTKPLTETYKDLLELQASREPFDVVTGKRKYKNMLFKSLSQTTDSSTENCLSITATLTEINIVDVEVTTVPPRARQKTPAKTGATQNVGVKKAVDKTSTISAKDDSSLSNMTGRKIVRGS
jgi:hypothetical protein